MLPNGRLEGTAPPMLWLSPADARRKLVVLDEGDGDGYYPPVEKDQYLAYFKRSWIRRRDGKYAGEPRRLPRSYLPMAYSISDDYLKPLFDHVVSAKGDSKHYRDGRGIT